MLYDIEANGMQWFQIGDKPDFSCLIYQTPPNGLRVPSTELMAATIRWPDQASGYAYVESMMTLLGGTPGKATWQAPSKLTRERAGEIIVAVYPEDAQATIDTAINDTDGSVDLTVVEGTVPASGFYLIGSEFGEFTYSAPTLTFTTRGTVSTNAAAHAQDAVIKLAAVRETALPKVEYDVFKDVL